MRKLYFFVFSILLIYSRIYAGNIVSNGDFETTTTTSNFWWTLYAGTGMSQIASIDNTGQISGTNSFKTTISSSGTSQTTLGVYQMMTLPKAATYTVSFKAKASSACTAQSMLVQSYSNYTWLANSPVFNITTATQTFTFDIKITTASTGLCKFAIYYGVGTNNGVTLYLDDITVTEKVQLTENNLCNGDFEAKMSNAIYNSTGYSYNDLTTGTPDATQNQTYYGWSKLVKSGGTANMTCAVDATSPISGTNSMKITSTGTASGSTSDLQFDWLFGAVKGKYYTLIFKAKGSANFDLPVTLTAWSSGAYIAEQTVPVTTTAQTFTVRSSVPFDNAGDNRAVLKFLLGKLPNGVSIWLDDIKLVLGIPVTSVSVTPSNALLSTNSTLQLTASVLPVDATNQTITWSSVDNTIASVDANGLVTTKNPGGPVNITATTQDGNFSAACAMTVQSGSIAVTGVAVNPTSASINLTQSTKINALIQPIGATNQAVSWSSDNTAVATVDQTGTVTGVSKGTANITATTQDGNFKASAVISVAIPLAGISFAQTSAVINAGTTYQLTPVFNPANATNTNLTYASSNTATAAVSASGLISAFAAGTSTITAVSADGGFKAVFQLFVYSTNLTLPNIIGNNMVLQQDTQAPLWGWGPPNENVQITLDGNSSVIAKTDANGKWMAKIPTPKAVSGSNQPKHTLTFVGKNNTVILSNILIGDVYLCSGQSNMGFTMQPNPGNTDGVLNYQAEIAAANYPNIRLNRPYTNPQYSPVDNVGGSWSECNPTSVAGFPAVPYFFARELYLNANVNIPIGVTAPAVGGSSSQSWTSREALAADPVLKANFLDPYDASPSLAYATASTVLYNGMIAPLIPFAIKGFLWYQGEANSGSTTGASYYTRLQTVMINDWRTRWGQGDIPFYFVQMPVYQYMNPAFRDQQTNVLTVANTGMAVSLEVGEVTNIHPRDKYTVAKRLSKIALAKIYGQNITYAGPTLKSATVEGNKIRIKYYPASVGSGLALRWNQTTLNEFQIAGSNGTFYAADAVIDGNDVLVSSPNVLSPTKVAFAYTNTSMPNLMNKDSLTACPFNTDTWNYTISIDAVTPNALVENNICAGIKIFPIPAHDKLHIEFPENISPTHYDILNIAGKSIFSSLNIKYTEKNIIDISALQNGFYIIKFYDDKKCQSVRFIKE